MPTYSYSGKQINGDLVEGSMSANDQSDLELRLLNRGISLERSGLSFSGWRKFVLATFSKTEVTRITRQLSLLLKSQISVLESLQLAQDQITDKDLRQVLASTISQVESGKSLAHAFGNFPFLFDRLYISMVEAGELSGNLDFALDTVAAYREKREQITRKIKSALAYPALVVIVAVLVIFALVLYVVPIFSSMYENFGAELPTLTRNVVAVSGYLKENLIYLTGTLITLVVSSAVASRTMSVRKMMHTMLFRLPIVKTMAVKLVTVRFCRTMGSLLTAGVDIIASIQIASRTTGNLYADAQLGPIALSLTQGKSFTESLESCRLFPKAMLRLTASGEKTARLGEMLTRSADYYEAQTETELATLTALIEPIIIVLLGAFIAFILVAMYLPLFDLVGKL